MERDKLEREKRQKFREDIGTSEKQRSPEGREIIRRLSEKLNEGEASRIAAAEKILSKLGIKVEVTGDGSSELGTEFSQSPKMRRGSVYIPGSPLAGRLKKNQSTIHPIYEEDNDAFFANAGLGPRDRALTGLSDLRKGFALIATRTPLRPKTG
jgi:hypothetical protein